jgi:hypothetical protein
MLYSKTYDVSSEIANSMQAPPDCYLSITTLNAELQTARAQVDGLVQRLHDVLLTQSQENNRYESIILGLKNRLNSLSKFESDFGLLLEKVRTLERDLSLSENCRSHTTKELAKLRKTTEKSAHSSKPSRSNSRSRSLPFHQIDADDHMPIQRMDCITTRQLCPSCQSHTTLLNKIAKSLTELNQTISLWQETGHIPYACDSDWLLFMSDRQSSIVEAITEQLR